MTTRILTLALACAAFAAAAGPVRAQGFNPWVNNNGIHAPGGVANHGFNPWVSPWAYPQYQPFGYGYGYQYQYQSQLNYGFGGPGYNSGYSVNQSFSINQGFGIQPGLNLNPNFGINGFNPYAGNGVVGGYGSAVEPGRFFRFGGDVAVNPVSGTVLRPYSGVAFTNAGTFYRIPGTANFTPFGTYIPGSGVYVNPFSGTLYNPQTGAIVGR